MTTSSPRIVLAGVALLVALGASAQAAAPLTGVPARSTWRGRATTVSSRGERINAEAHTHLQIHGDQVFVRSRVPNPLAPLAEAAGHRVRPTLDQVTRGTIKKVGRSKQGGILMQVAFGGRDYTRRTEATVNEGLATLAPLGLDMQVGVDVAEGESFLHFKPDGRLELQIHGFARIASATGRHAQDLSQGFLGDLETLTRGVLDRTR